MKWTREIRRAVLLATMLLWVGGCNGLFLPRARYERTVELQQAMEAGSTLAVSTASGSIDVQGAAVGEAQVTATITGYASTEEEAMEIAEQVEIGFQQTTERVEIKADRPRLSGRRSISISYDIIVPEQTSLHCISASGSIGVADLQGSVQAQTASGSVTAERIGGSVRLHSASGSVKAREVRGGDVGLYTASGSVRLWDASEIGQCGVHSSSGSVAASGVEADRIKISAASGSVDLDDAKAAEVEMCASSGHAHAREIECSRLEAESSSGSVSVTFTPTTPGDVSADLRATSGSVTVVPPPDFAGRVDLSSTSGSVRSNLPVLVRGRMDKKHITGTVGEGSGSLSARTTSGSVTIR